MKSKNKDWIQEATAKMEKKGTVGLFTKKAEKRGLTAEQFAKKVLKNPNYYDLKTRKQAQYAANVAEEYGWGGFILGSAIGGYAGYKVGKGQEKSKDVFKVEKKIIGKIDKEANEARDRRAKRKKEKLELAERAASAYVTKGGSELAKSGSKKMAKGGSMASGGNLKTYNVQVSYNQLGDRLDNENGESSEFQNTENFTINARNKKEAETKAVKELENAFGEDLDKESGFDVYATPEYYYAKGGTMKDNIKNYEGYLVYWGEHDDNLPSYHWYSNAEWENYKDTILESDFEKVENAPFGTTFTSFGEDGTSQVALMGDVFSVKKTKLLPYAKQYAKGGKLSEMTDKELNSAIRQAKKDNDNASFAELSGARSKNVTLPKLRSLQEEKSRRKMDTMAKGGSMASGGVVYSVDIDLEDGEQIRGNDVEFSDLSKAQKLYQKLLKSEKYNGENIENIQLLAVQKNGNYEVLESEFFAKGGKTQGNKEYIKNLKNTIEAFEEAEKRSILQYEKEFNRKEVKKHKILLEKATKKMAKGGMTQGYNARLDESLGNRKGKKSTKKQSYKDRRDESKGMEKASGKRAYSSVGTMDNNGWGINLKW